MERFVNILQKQDLSVEIYGHFVAVRIKTDYTRLYSTLSFESLNALCIEIKKDLNQTNNRNYMSMIMLIHKALLVYQIKY